MQSLRIAMLTHSVNPRGGVVHAMQLAEALHDLGHQVMLIAAAESDKDFFRPLRCRRLLLPLSALSGDLLTDVAQRIQAYMAYFARPDAETYDIYHAQDAISGCALAALVEQGMLKGFIRTVHHLEHFANDWLMASQSRSFRAAQQVLCVSREWQHRLQQEYGISTVPVNNGIDAQRYSPQPQTQDAALSQALGLTRGGPVFLAVGGIEARKNTLGIFSAFRQILPQKPNAQLLIVGGASLLDHSGYQQRFAAALAESGLQNLADPAVVITGPLADAAMPSLFRLADALVFPSLNEGFGLVVLEAIASGTPAIVSNRPPFIDYLSEQDCLWADPEDSGSIAAAMMAAIATFPKQRLAQIAQRLNREFSWAQSAAAHQAIYQNVINTQGAQYA